MDASQGLDFTGDDEQAKGRAVTVLVTGGGGFIGSNLVDALVAGGEEVVVLDDFSTGRRENLDGATSKGARLVEGDVADAQFVERLVGEVRPDVIHHLAAQVDVRRSVSDPQTDARVNVLGALSVLEAARLHGAKRLVYVSTGGAIYGEAKAYPTREDADVKPMSPYGTNKYAAELSWELYGRLHGMSTVTLRLANVYGPRQDPLGEGGVVAIFSRVLLTGEGAVIFGDGEQTRDFVEVSDVARACLAASQAEVLGAFNIGSGTETTINQLAAEMSSVIAERSLEITHEPERDGEVRRSCLDASRAGLELGWKPQISLAEGLRRTLDWQAQTSG